MTVRLAAIGFDADDPVGADAFWRELLGPDAAQLEIRFAQATTPRPHRNRLHLHVTTSSLDDERETVETALRLGGRSQGRGAPPIGRDVYLIDSDGNEFCVIEPGNQYLVGTGRLGEVTCDGTRAAAEFWRDALGWSAVWDEGDQLAIQSPDGGTKLGWDAWQEPRDAGWNRQRFELTASDLEADVDRLVSLGATRVGTRGNAILLHDPDASEFLVHPTPAAP